MGKKTDDQAKGTQSTRGGTSGQKSEDVLQRILEAEEALRKKSKGTGEFINERKASINRGARRAGKRFSL